MLKRKQKQPPSEAFRRIARIDRAEVDADKRTVELSFSSETAVRDFFDETVLLHESGAADFSRMEAVGSALFNHDPDRIVGPIVSVELDEDARKGRATIRFDDTEDGELAFSRVKSGSLRGVSVGFVVLEAQRLGDEETWTSPEGRDFTGPLLVATRWQPLELSLTPIPADSAVGVGRTNNPMEATEMRISAKLRAALIARGMSATATDDEALAYLNEHPEILEETTRAAPPVAPPAPDPTDTSSARIERARQSELRRIARQVDLDTPTLDTWLDGEITPDAARRVAMERLSAAHPPVSATPPRAEVIDEPIAKFTRFAAAGMARRLRLPLDADAPKDAPHGISLVFAVRELCRLYGEINAHYLPIDQLIRTRSFSHVAGDFAQLLETVAAKSLQAGYTEAQTTYERWTSLRSLRDFKSSRAVNFGGVKDFGLVPELMPIAESTITDSSESWSLSTYGTQFGLSRQALINDDLGGFGRMIQMMGASWRRTKNKLVYDHILQASGLGPTMAEDSLALFSATHTSGSNYVSTGAAPSTTTIGALKALLRKQKDLTGDATLNIIPTIILVPAVLETLVEALVNGIVIPTTEATALVSGVRSLEVVVEPYLEGKTDGDTAWFLIASSALIETVLVASLEGQGDAPVIQRIEGVDVLGTRWVAYGDFAVRAVDHRGIAKNKGD